MKIIFVNGSKQQKCLLESDYADDLFDTMIGFFEEHGKYPHFLKAQTEGEDLKITFESQSEYFLLSGASEEQREEFSGFLENEP